MMNKKEIFRKIGGIISELTEQYQYLSDNFDDLNDLELELFTANSKFLTDHAEILKKLNTKPSQSGHRTEPGIQESPSASDADEVTEETPLPAPSELPDVAAHEIETEEPKEELEFKIAEEDIQNHSAGIQEEKELPGEKETAEPEYITKSLDSVEHEQVQEAYEEEGEKQAAAEEHLNETVQEVIIPEKTVNVEIPQPQVSPAPRPTLNDLISAQKSQAAAAGINRPQQIKDLKSAISLNDKLLFIKELFNGYSLAYSEAIEILNRFETFDAADAFLKTNYAEKNNWIAKEPIVDKLYELLRSRYSL